MTTGAVKRKVNSPSSSQLGVKPNRFGGSASLLLLSIVFHSIYLNSIFDVYFVSPVTKGVPLRYGVGSIHEQGGSGAQSGERLAKRVVLIVGDGLRADKLFQTYPNPPFPNNDDQSIPLPAASNLDPHLPHSIVSVSGSGPAEQQRTTPAPFLRSLIQTGQAQWGISHTRVPTESRPGHVALIGGMYEDVSAVTRGWQTNPVSFDSVFNQSTHAFTFGSPDILPMFQKGASDPQRVDAWSYDEQMEDFSKDAVHLDLWVLEQLKHLFLNATTDPRLDRQLRSPGIVFFLHLLGLDTTGHSYRPHGPEYHRNIRVVDHVVSEANRLLDQFYDGDQETAFVFTADHGMSSKGNHGDGEPDNTRTPLIAWGKGIQNELHADQGNDEYSSGWDLRGKRKDVDQADVAVLMSILGGLAIPANSAGRIPLEYLDAEASFKARAAFANAKQILAEYEQRHDFKRAHAISFKPFSELTDDASAGYKSIESHKRDIEALIQLGDFTEAAKRSTQLVDLGLDGIRYFQTYDWLILKSIVAAGYVGFIFYSTSFILRKHVYEPSAPTSVSIVPRALGFLVFAALSTKFCIERSSFTYYAYALFPTFFWSSILSNLRHFQRLLRSVSPSSLLLTTISILAFLQAIAQGYLFREYFTFVLVTMALGWPFLGMSKAFRKKEKKIVVAWTAACSALSVFPQLPVEKGESLKTIYGGTVIMLIGALISREVLERQQLTRPKSANNTSDRTLRWMAVQMGLLLLSLIATVASTTALQAKRGLPLWSQSLGWIVLIASILTPILHGRPRNQPHLERLVIILCAFGPSFTILSLSYEGLFYALFCATLCVWLSLEKRLIFFASDSKRATNAKTSKIVGDHVRIAIFFLTFLHVAFFGVGNVASISSFYLEPVYRLIPVFSPFAMALLLLFKLLSPFVALSAVTSLIGRQLNLPPFSLFIIASTLSDILTINFFFRVTDQGSWLEIGSTITNFAISSLLCIFNTALYLGGEFLVAHTSIDQPSKITKEASKTFIESTPRFSVDSKSSLTSTIEATSFAATVVGDSKSLRRSTRGEVVKELD